MMLKFFARIFPDDLEGQEMWRLIAEEFHGDRERLKMVLEETMEHIFRMLLAREMWRMGIEDIGAVMILYGV